MSHNAREALHTCDQAMPDLSQRGKLLSHTCLRCSPCKMAEFAPRNTICLGVPPVAFVKAAASAMAAVPICAASAMVTARSTLVLARPVAWCQVPLAVLPLPLLLIPLVAFAATLLMSADSRLTEGVNT